MSRCDSAATVPKTSELLPEPEMPVNTVSRRFGISTLTSLRLLTRAPWTRISSWLSAAAAAGARLGVVVAISAALVDADEVPRGVADRAVADPVELVRGLLHDLGPAGLHPLEGAVEVGGGHGEDPVGALGHHLDDRAALVVGDPRVDSRRVEDDRGGGGIAGGADRHPPHRVLADVVPDLEAEDVAVEGDGGLGVVVGQEGRVHGDVHGRHARCGSERSLLDS